MKWLLLIALCFMMTAAAEEGGEISQRSGYMEESEYFVFYSHYWLNMHHFFYLEALSGAVLQHSIIDTAMIEVLPAGDKGTIVETANYYAENLIEKDLRFDEYMASFRRWIILQEEESITDVPPRFSDHMSVLTTADELYRSRFWAAHLAANRKVLADNMALILKTEKSVVDTLSRLTRQFWQEEKIPVDICYVAKATARNMRNRPYTSLYPTHIVMNASGAADVPPGNWIELLYHEASHNLIGSQTGFVGGTIQDVVSILGGAPPRSLWHAYLFYFSGKVTQHLLAMSGMTGYELYMVRNGVFAWYLPYLEQHLTGYMEGESTLEDATHSIISGYRASQQ